MIAKTQKFFFEVVSELKKVTWSTKQEVIDATWLVLITSISLGLFIGITDVVLSKFLQVIIR